VLISRLCNDPGAHFIHWAFRGDFHQATFLAIEIQERTDHPTKYVNPLPNGSWLVIYPPEQFPATRIAHPGPSRWHRRFMARPPACPATQPTRETPHDFIVGNSEVKCLRDLATKRWDDSFQGFCLGQRAWIAIQDEAAGVLTAAEHRPHQLSRHFVRDELSALDELLSAATQRRRPEDVIAEMLAGREMLIP
jgi:hypothetical protein